MKKSPKNKSLDLSVIILNYNSGKYLSDCLQSLAKSNIQNYQIEYIVVDNASTDNSLTLARRIKLPHCKIISSPGNIGFSAGNNFGIRHTGNSKYVLFLNPDTNVRPNTLAGMIGYFDRHPEVDAATCNVILALTGNTQPECHRGFPTPNNTFWHFFGLGLPRLFPRSKFFNGYFMGHLDYTRVQKIDCCVGAFLMVKRSVGNKIKWWNEKYFMYGEDLDFCYQLRKNNFQLYFIPDYKIIHYQGISSGIKKTTSAADRHTKIRSSLATTNAMKIFYQQNLIHDYPPILHPLIYLGIDIIKLFRLFKAKYL